MIYSIFMGTAINALKVMGSMLDSGKNCPVKSGLINEQYDHSRLRPRRETWQQVMGGLVARLNFCYWVSKGRKQILPKLEGRNYKSDENKSPFELSSLFS